MIELIKKSKKKLKNLTSGNQVKISSLKAKTKNMKREKLPSPTEAIQFNSKENLYKRSENLILNLMLAYQKSFGQKLVNWIFIQKISFDGFIQNKSKRRKEVEKHFSLKCKKGLLSLLLTIQRWKENIF